MSKISNVWYDKLEGIQITRANAHEVADAIGGRAVSDIGHGVAGVIINTSRGNVIAYEGSWICREPNSERYRILEMNELDLDHLKKDSKIELKVSE